MKPNRLLTAVATTLTGALLLGACSATPQPSSSSAPSTSATASTPAASDAIIEVGSLYEPSNLSNTDAGGQGVTQAFNGNVYEGLLKLNDDGSVSNLLADSYQASEDGLTYTFKLHPGVTFHSGKALTSADVKASFERVTSESSQAARKSSYAVVDSIETPDDATVVFHLKTRSISFPYLLSYVWVVNTEVADLKADADGTGPYTFSDWRRGSTLSIVRNDSYWGEPAKNAGATFHYFTDASSQDNALLTGEIDVIASEQGPDALSQFEGNPDFQVSEGTSTTKQLLAFNDKAKPFTDAGVRKAIYSAIDRQKLLDAVWAGRGTVIGSMVPPTDPWYEDLVSLNPYDPELSRKLLTEAGLPNGFSFTLSTPNYDPHPATAEFLKSELAKIGVTVEIKTITADEWYTDVFQKRDYQATLQEHVNDRDVVWYGNPDFYWQYDNAKVTELVDSAEQAATPQEQADLLKQANRIIAGDAASAWLFLYPQIVVAKSDVSGFPVNGLNSQFFVYNITKSA